MKVHINYKGKALCGRKKARRDLRFAEQGRAFNDYPESERCGNCRRAKER
jgi:hypothetical protein